MKCVEIKLLYVNSGKEKTPETVADLITEYLILKIQSHRKNCRNLWRPHQHQFWWDTLYRKSNDITKLKEGMQRGISAIRAGLRYTQLTQLCKRHLLCASIELDVLAVKIHQIFHRHPITELQLFCVEADKKVKLSLFFLN
jgi:hypothetical protein